MKKGAFANHSSDFEKLWKGFHVQINARSDKDLNKEKIIAKLKTATGASFYVKHEGQFTEKLGVASGITYARGNEDQTTESKPQQSTIKFAPRNEDQ